MKVTEVFIVTYTTNENRVVLMGVYSTLELAHKAVLSINLNEQRAEITHYILDNNDPVQNWIYSPSFQKTWKCWNI